MPPWLHLVLIIIITIYFIVRFIRDRHIYELIFVVWAPSTLLQYVSSDETFIRALGIFQVIMLILAVFFMFRRRGDARRKTAQILADYATGDLDKAIGKPLGIETPKAATEETAPADPAPKKEE